jgi:hypothetical protein
MLPLEDSRLLKPAKSPVLASSPLQTKPPSTPRVHSSSSPSSAYQAYRQGERESSPASKPKPSAHPHLPSGHISSSPRPTVRRESEWSPADEKAAIRRAQTKLKTHTPAKPSKPLVTHEDDARETRRFQNQVAAARIANKPATHHTYGSANATEHHDPDFKVVSGVTKGAIWGTNRVFKGVQSASQVTKLQDSGTFITYSFRDSSGAVRYAGRASGTGTPKQVLEARISKGHDIAKAHPELKPHIEATQSSAVANRGAEDVLYSQHQVRNPTPINGKRIAGGANYNEGAKQLLNRTNPLSNELPKVKKFGRGAIESYAKDLSVTSTDTSRVARALENTHFQGATRGVSKVLVPVAIGLDAWNLKNSYQKDGFGKEFRKTAGSVAGGWGGAAAGAELGAAVGSVVPGVGTAVGALAGGVIGGIAGSELGDNIEQGAEKLGKGAVNGAKKLWHGVFG